jgi:hypothetical protein
MVRKYTDEELLTRVKELKSFKKIPKGRWILGVRSNEDIPNKFDDKFYVYDGEEFVVMLEGTTNPGVSILKNHSSFNKLGAAILKSDEWYYDVWHYGMHRNRIPGLLQRGAKMKVYRDGDKDNKSEEQGVLQEGYFGINFHLNSHDINVRNRKVDINGWSAGCQVPNEPLKYKPLLEWFRDNQKVTTYCLINEF